MAIRGITQGAIGVRCWGCHTNWSQLYPPPAWRALWSRGRRQYARADQEEPFLRLALDFSPKAFVTWGSLDVSLQGILMRRVCPNRTLKGMGREYQAVFTGGGGSGKPTDSLPVHTHDAGMDDHSTWKSHCATPRAIPCLS